MSDPVTLALGCRPDWLQHAAASITASGETLGSPASALLDPVVSRRWRCEVGAVSLGHRCHVAWDLGIARRIGCGALVGHSGTSRATIRWRFSDAPLSLDPVVDMDGSGGWTSTGDAQQIGVGPRGVSEQPVGSYRVGPGATWRTTLQAPGDDLDDGADQQLIRVRMWSAFQEEPLPLPVSVRLYDAGVLVRELGVMTTATEAIYELAWTASEVGDPDDVEIEIANAAGASASAFVGGLDWIPAHPPAPGVVSSGWRPMLLDPVTYAGLGLSDIAVHDLRATASHLLLGGDGALAQVDRRYGMVEIRDARAPGGVFEAGRLAVGPAATLRLSSSGLRIWVIDPTVVERTRGGDPWRSIRRPRLAAAIPTESPSDVGVRDLLGAIYRAQGRAGDFLVSLLPLDPSAAPLAFWAMHAGERGEIGYRGVQRSDSPEPWAWGSTLEVEEV
ncbi:MAG: hypothetical protein AAGN46_01220 [Acidobacteriota bacterium]